MGKSSRAFYQREIKGQKRELLESVETDKFGGDKNLAKRQAALERAAAAPKIPVVSKIKHNDKDDKRAGQQGASMDVDGGHQGEAATQRDSGEDRLRRVLAVTGCGVTKRHKDKKNGNAAMHLAAFMPVQPNKLKERRLKKALKRTGKK